MLRRSTTCFFLGSTSTFLKKAKSNANTTTSTNTSSSTTSSSSTTAPHTARRIAPHIKHELTGDEDGEDDIPQIRVGVLQPHNEGTWPEDDVRCSPALVSSPRLKKELSFDQFTIRKNSAFKQLRTLTSEDKCDVFWNLCDGARDEVRTGEDTVRILESLNVPFTGADSQGFEPSKIEMKMLLAAAGIKTPNFAVLDRSDVASAHGGSGGHGGASHGSEGGGAAGGGSGGGGSSGGSENAMSNNNDGSSRSKKSKNTDSGIVKACSHLRFPVIVKHISGYGSVGIKADSKCDNMEQLVKKVKTFVKEFDVALVEEFIIGEEGTAFVCADQGSPTGCHVFPPLMIPVPGGPTEFLYFEKKWVDLKKLDEKEGDGAATKKGSKKKQAAEDTKKDSNADSQNNNNKNKEEHHVITNPAGYTFLERGKTLTDKIEKMAANAFIHIMQRVGYGRCDFRIDQVTKEPYFLEINPNCGIFLPYEKTGAYKEGYGDFADLMIEQDWGHDKFVKTQIDIAMKHQRARVPWWNHTYSASAGSFVTKCAKSVPRLTRVFGDDVRPIPVVARTLFDATLKYKVPDDVPKVGCAIFRADTNIQNCVMIQHSCKPNCALVHSNTLELATVRGIQRGEMLTIDYATLRDSEMPDFRCNCGADTCRGIVKAQSPKIRGERGNELRVVSSDSGNGIGMGDGSKSIGSGSGSNNNGGSNGLNKRRQEIQKKSSSAVKSSSQQAEEVVVVVEKPVVIDQSSLLLRSGEELRQLRLRRKKGKLMKKLQQQTAAIQMQHQQQQQQQQLKQQESTPNNNNENITPANNVITSGSDSQGQN